MKKKIIFIGNDSDNPIAPVNLLPRNFLDLGYEVITIYGGKIKKQEAINIINNNRDACCILTYGRGTLFPIENYSIPQVIWMPSIITGSRDIQSLVKNFEGVYNIVYTCLPTEIPLYKKCGIDAKPLFAAIDENIFKFLPIEQDIELGFFGNINYENRKKFLGHVLKKFKMYTDYSTTKYVELMNRTKINFNVGYYDFGIPNRVFDTLGCGQFLLTHEYKNEDNIFQDGKHLSYFTYSDIYDKIEYYINHPEKREKIAKQGQEEVLKKHTYKHRIKTIMEDVSKL